MSDHRHERRIKLMQDLFACTFNEDNQKICLEDKPEDSTVVKIIQDLDTLDAAIKEAAPERPLSEINKVDLAIIRLILFESMNKKTPKKVLLNEAIELAKYYSGETSPGFVNGVLAKLILDGSENDKAKEKNKETSEDIKEDSPESDEETKE